MGGGGGGGGGTLLEEALYWVGHNVVLKLKKLAFICMTNLLHTL